MMGYDREASIKHAREMDEIRRIEQRKSDIKAAILVIPALAGLVCYYLGVAWVTDLVKGLVAGDPVNWAALSSFVAGLWVLVRVLNKFLLAADAMSVTWKKIKDATPDFDDRNPGK